MKTSNCFYILVKTKKKGLQPTTPPILVNIACLFPTFSGENVNFWHPQTQVKVEEEVKQVLVSEMSPCTHSCGCALMVSKERCTLIYVVNGMHSEK